MIFLCDRPTKVAMFGWIFTYAVLVVLSVAALHYLSVPWLPLRLLVALLPVVPLFGILNLGMHKFREADELQKKITAEGITFGFGVTTIVTLSYGFLQANDLAPDVSFTWVWPILGAGWIVGQLLARRRYQ
jgi:hypothetical protein